MDELHVGTSGPAVFSSLVISGPDACNVIGRPSSRAAPHSFLASSVVTVPRVGLESSPMFLEQMPSVIRPSFGSPSR